MEPAQGESVPCRGAELMELCRVCRGPATAPCGLCGAAFCEEHLYDGVICPECLVALDQREAHGQRLGGLVGGLTGVLAVVGAFLAGLFEHATGPIVLGPFATLAGAIVGRAWGGSASRRRAQRRCGGRWSAR